MMMKRDETRPQAVAFCGRCGFDRQPRLYRREYRPV